MNSLYALVLKIVSSYIFICAACGSSLTINDILVLPLDIVDTASHSAATEKVLKTFGQVGFCILGLCVCVHTL